VTVPQQPQLEAPHVKAPHAPQQQAPTKERVAGQTDAPVPAGEAQAVHVELGAHSASNFYKGLSGNDVLEHGGVFVATYKIPKIGDPIALKMLLPGDLEFPADAIVQWIRESRSGDAEPGFGAKFTRISPEGRELIYRYVRNREPMFYDDM
jgi:Tfp pilus assembly protein PilZ